jgi:hypothetical protein
LEDENFNKVLNQWWDSIKEKTTQLIEKENDKDLLDQSLKISHVKDFLNKLTNGVDTLIGERGVKLSGGERQRVADLPAVPGFAIGRFEGGLHDHHDPVDERWIRGRGGHALTHSAIGVASGPRP